MLCRSNEKHMKVLQTAKPMPIPQRALESALKRDSHGEGPIHYSMLALRMPLIKNPGIKCAKCLIRNISPKGVSSQ